ncbi:MAG: 5-nucleotidase / UDP-sugar diphosphatase [Halanaerobiales bacterium]|nr:5-nucleotidase / UDP-sugar diphosphatase [Halanaerobiales bacterium]
MRKRLLTSLMLVMVLVLVSSLAMAEKVEITILHTNDTHSRVEEGKYAGMGFAKLSTLVKEERAKNPNLLLLDAGDTFHGQTIANLVEGESIVKIMNAIGYDAMATGNHDFNFGKERLLELNEMTDFPILAANIKYEDDSPFLDAYVIKEVGGVKVAIFGLATPETTYKTHPKNVKSLVFESPVKAAKVMVDQLKDKADVIIALTHLGLSEGSEYTSAMVAKEVPGIDLIVDGHSHHALKEGKRVGDTLIVMAGEYDKNLGVVNLTVEDGKVIAKKARLITKEDTANTEKDTEILKVIDQIKAEIEKITSVVVGKTAVHLDGERENVRTGETNLGNLITDAMLDTVDADVAITNGGGIRASIGKGEVTKGEVITVLPFGNFVVVKELKGSVILDAIEHGISAYPAKEGQFPQVGGMSFIFAPSRPAGERVVKLEIGGEPVDYDKTYRVATNDFMAAGGDGYTMFKDAATVQEAGGLEEVVMNYIKEHGTVAPKVEGRIIAVEQSGDKYSYTVRSGDTLLEIALKFDVTVEDLVKVNNLKDADLIFAGQEILIPVK